MNENEKLFLELMRKNREEIEKFIFLNEDFDINNEIHYLKFIIYSLILEIDELKVKFKQKDLFMSRIDSLLKIIDKNN